MWLVAEVFAGRLTSLAEIPVLHAGGAQRRGGKGEGGERPMLSMDGLCIELVPAQRCATRRIGLASKNSRSDGSSQLPATISVRAYLISLHREGKRKAVPFSDAAANHPGQFVQKFVDGHKIPVDNAEAERTWYFDLKDNIVNEEMSGIINYGTYGFSSTLKDGVTKKQVFKRKANDIEEVPLFFKFWFPQNSDKGFVIFQSFQGRSCISLIMTQIRDQYAAISGDLRIGFSKLVPSMSARSAFGRSTVKRVTFVKKSAPSDRADSYLGPTAADKVNYVLSFSTPRRAGLGPFSGIYDKIHGAQTGVYVVHGLEFDQATAEVMVGEAKRRVGIFGDSADAGLIEVTDQIKRGADGHPTYKSIKGECDQILEDFYNQVHGIDI